MENLVSLRKLIRRNRNVSVRKVEYKPDEGQVVFNHQQTGCTISVKDKQIATTEMNHEWYPFIMIDGTDQEVLCIVPDAVPKFRLCLEGWAGYFDQIDLLVQFANLLYGNKRMNTIGMPLSPTAIRAMQRLGLLQLISYDDRVWVGTYARPSKGVRMLKLQCMNKLSKEEITSVPMYDLDRGSSSIYEAGILPIVKLPPDTLVDEMAFKEGGPPLKLILPEM